MPGIHFPLTAEDIDVDCRAKVIGLENFFTPADHADPFQDVSGHFFATISPVTTA